MGTQATPPALLHGARAPYPPEAAGRPEPVIVELEVEIDAEGKVAALRVLSVSTTEHETAFADAAMQAVSGFVFRPAKRAGQALRSRVRYAYQFDPPQPAEPLAVEAAPKSAEPVSERPPAADAKTAVAEYGATATAEAESGAATRRTVKAETVRQLAGTRGDAIRAVELMPGVGRVPGGDGELLVRGASPQDTQVMLEGSPVLLLYHFGSITSFFNSQLLRTLQFYPGNFGVRYGRSMGGIVDVTVRDPRRDRFHGLLDVNLIDGTLLLEGPLGERGAIMAAGRRSWIDAMFGAFAPDTLDVKTAPVYYDYQAAATVDLSARDHLRVLTYGSRDQLRLLVPEAPDGEPKLHGKANNITEFYRAETRWQHRYSHEARHEISVGVGWLGLKLQLGELVSQEIHGPRVYGRAEWLVAVADALQLRFGLDHYTLAGDVRYTGSPMGQDSAVQDGPHIDIDRVVSIHRPAAYLELTIQATERWDLTPGVRVDYTSDADAFSVDPRLVSRVRVTEGGVVKLGTGWFHQPPELGAHIPDLGNPAIEPSRALHSLVGFEQSFPFGLRVGLEAYHKRLWDLVVDTEDNQAPYIENAGEGRIYGAELSARYDRGRYFGYASYTLSRSERKRIGSPYHLSAYDQPHILNLAAGARWPRGWQLSGTFRYISGTPYTPVQAGLYDADTGLYLPVMGSDNSARGAAYHRLDVRLLKRWAIGRGSFAVYLDLQNAYNNQPKEDVSYSFDYREKDTSGGMPVIPSLGLRGEL